MNQSMKWLQSLAAICIDPKRCPDTAREFGEYEYEVGKDGQVLPGYPDADNHHIDAVRYATNRLWTRRGPDAVDVVQVYGIALEKGEYDSSDYANSLNWLWSRMKDMVADLRQTLKGGDAA